MSKHERQMASSKVDGFASICGSPGARVRFMGFFCIFWPFLLVVFAAGWLLNSALPVSISPPVAGLLLLALVLVAWIAFSSAGRRFEAFLKGARGEEIVARELALLPSGWDVFHGVPRAGIEGMAGGGDFDHIVVGPNSVFVIETKNWDGPVTVDRGVMRVRGKVPGRSPVAQARKEAMQLAGLIRDSLPEGMAVKPLVCFAGDAFADDEVQVDDVGVCNVRVLRNIILEADGEEIDDGHRRSIIEKLSARLYG